MVTEEQLAAGWGIAWRAALATSVAAVALALALRWFLDVPATVVVAAVATGGLAVGWRLPAARFTRRPEVRY